MPEESRMVWQNAQQLAEAYPDQTFRDAFSDLYSLREFLANCIVLGSYQPPVAFGKSVHLTLSGQEWASRAAHAIDGLSPEDAKLAVFMAFYHRDLFVDVTATAPEPIRTVLDAEIRAGNIRFAWVYDRLLYDRFFDMFPSRTSGLSHDETLQLLDGTPQGVFQLKELVVGPLGVQISCCHRFLAPVRSVPLWHCSDPSCPAFHPVDLSTAQTGVSAAVKFIGESCLKEEGSASEWDDVLRVFVKRPDHYDDMHAGKFPWLLPNAFSERELQVVAGRMFDGYPRDLRQHLAQVAGRQELLSKSATRACGRLSKAECLQIALLASDEVAAESVESCVEDGSIRVPPTETRRARLTRGYGGWFDTDWECSQFGVRATSEGLYSGVLRLKRLIKQIYGGDRGLSELEWRLRHIEGESIHEKLDCYLRSDDPKRVVRELVLSSAERLQVAFAMLRYGHFSMPSSPQEEERLVEKILWKLGFDVRTYPPHQPLFWQRLERLLEVARRHLEYNEGEREEIRGVAANFFVSLEEILDYALSFCTWALLSDHYAGTRFALDFDSARRVMASRLSGRQSKSGNTLVFDAGGKNTLYPLIAGFSCLADLSDEMLAEKSDTWRRPESGQPGYHSRTDLAMFPFLHTALLFDLRQADRERIIGLLHEISRELDSCQVTDVRNRIEHRRPSFPTQQEIERVCTTVTRIVTKMESSGLSPLLYLYAGQSVDEHGRITVTLRDYRGREIQIPRPSEYDHCGLPSPRVPSVVVPWIRIGESCAMMRFRYQESSDYASMWEGYPKRRSRTDTPSQTAVEDTLSSGAREQISDEA